MFSQQNGFISQWQRDYNWIPQTMGNYRQAPSPPSHRLQRRGSWAGLLCTRAHWRRPGVTASHWQGCCQGRGNLPLWVAKCASWCGSAIARLVGTELPRWPPTAPPSSPSIMLELLLKDLNLEKGCRMGFHLNHWCEGTMEKGTTVEC